FWSPFVNRDAGEWQFGAATGGVDPLFRHAYGIEAHRGSRTARETVQGFYQYDRFLPTLLLTGSDKSEPSGDDVLRSREVGARLTFPLARSFRSAQSLSVAWRFKEQELLDARTRAPHLGGVETAWALSTARQYPYSISPVEGCRIRLAVLREDRLLGSEFPL